MSILNLFRKSATFCILDYISFAAFMKNVLVQNIFFSYCSIILQRIVSWKLSSLSSYEVVVLRRPYSVRLSGPLNPGLKFIPYTALCQTELSISLFSISLSSLPSKNHSATKINASNAPTATVKLTAPQKTIMSLAPAHLLAS